MSRVQERPDVVIKDGLRPDGRGFEMFRSVCECPPFALIKESCTCLTFMQERYLKVCRAQRGLCACVLQSCALAC